MALQVRRGTNAERLGITPLAGELIYVTDTKQLYIGDGTTAGGTTSIAGTIDALLADTSPQLGGELDLNGNNITGTGNINITGTISASGNINLGDGVGSDILVIGGAIQGHLVPDTDITWNLGSTSKHFNEAWISQLNVENQLTVGRIMGDLIADDSTVVFDASTGLVASAQLTGTLPAGVIPSAMSSNITGNLTGNVTGNADGAHTGTLVGDVTGSVFDDGSSLLVDANNSKIVGDIDTQNATVTRTGSDVPTLVLKYTAETDLIADTTHGMGTLAFHRSDPINGDDCVAKVSANTESLQLWQSNTQQYGVESNWVTFKGGNFGVGKWNPGATLDINGFAKLAVLTAAPGTPAEGMIAIADGATWDPSGSNATKKQTVVYLGTAWVQIAIEA